MTYEERNLLERIAAAVEAIAETLKKIDIHIAVEEDKEGPRIGGFGKGN
jgi:hypothetical protein